MTHACAPIRARTRQDVTIAGRSSLFSTVESPLSVALLRPLHLRQPRATLFLTPAALPTWGAEDLKGLLDLFQPTNPTLSAHDVEAKT